MAGDDRRRYPRLELPLYYRAAGLFAPRTPVRDVSLGGVRVLTDAQLKVGQRLEIELFFPDGLSLTATVRVAWIAAAGEARYETGLAFLGLSADKAALIAQHTAPLDRDDP